MPASTGIAKGFRNQCQCCPKPTREQSNGGDWRGEFAARLKGFRRQRLCQNDIGVAGPVLVPPARLRCGIKASATKGCGKTHTGSRQWGSGGARASAAGAIAVRSKGFRSLETNLFPHCSSFGLDFWRSKMSCGFVLVPTWGDLSPRFKSLCQKIKKGEFVFSLLLLWAALLVL